MTLKILHLIDSGGLYGAEVMLLNLVAEQVKAGLSPLILSVGTPGISKKGIELEAEKRGLPVKAFRMKAGINLLKAFHLVRYAKKEGFNVMHSHGYKFNILIGVIPRFIRKVPLMATLHGYTSTSGFSKIKVYQWLERALLGRLDGIVFVSGEIKKKPILKGFKAKNEAVILNGIDSTMVTDAARDNKSASIQEIFPAGDDNCTYIGAIGRLSQEKGYELLIDVFKDLVVSNPNLRLVIIGEGVLRIRLERQIKTYKMESYIKLPGFISPVYRLMSDLDGLIMPSYTEGLPITLLEACILKLPIIASRVGSIEAVLLDYESSIVVSPGDVGELKAAIKKLILGGPTRDVNEGQWDIAKFDSKNMSEKYTQFYHRLLAA